MSLRQDSSNKYLSFYGDNFNLKTINDEVLSNNEKFKLLRINMDDYFNVHTFLPPNGLYLFRHCHFHHGHYLDILFGSSSCGAHATLFGVNGDPNQKWMIMHYANGYYTIQNHHSKLFLTLCENEYLCQQQYTGQDNQLFQFIRHSAEHDRILIKMKQNDQLLMEIGQIPLLPRCVVQTLYVKTSPPFKHCLLLYEWNLAPTNWC